MCPFQMAPCPFENLGRTLLNGAKWVGHPPGKNFYDYFHDFVIVMHLIGCKIRLCRNYSVTNLGLLFIPDTSTQLQSINHLTT